MSTDDPLPEWVIIKVTDRSLIVAAQERDMDKPRCEVCGEPMPEGEEMFKIHGYSGNCPKPPLPQALTSSTQDRIAELERERDELSQMASDANLWAEKQGQLAMRALAENRALREALKAARYELSVAASYADDPEATVGLRVHGKACAKALAAVDACIVYTRAPSERSE